jgi:phosphoglycolate phosphatase
MSFDDYLVLFDLDGTLVDTVESIIDCANFARLESGFPARDREEIFHLVGMPPALFFDDLKTTDVENAKLVVSFRKKLNEIEFDESNLYPGTLNVLNFFRGIGMKMAIATNKPGGNAELLLTKTKIREYFIHIQGSDGLKPKPNPEILLTAMKACSANKAFMVGDRAEDLIAAGSLGLKSIGVAQTSHVNFQLLNAGASHVFNNMEHFAENLAKKGFLDSVIL